jgi:predicted nuclease of predicted toxin-antitoxin system
MTAVWVDAQLSPALATWLRSAFGVEAHALRALDLRDAEDQTIFEQARRASAIVVTKDRDFVDLVTRHGPPPQIVWLTCGNTSNAFLREILLTAWPRAAALLQAGEPLVEIGGMAF